jgi:hypothetical protein
MLRFARHDGGRRRRVGLQAAPVLEIIAVLALASYAASSAHAATTQRHYYAHDAVEDKHGVIAPWYKGQNGQLDFRVRIAAETLKRYPWADTRKAVAAAPEYVFNGAWKIAPDGKITIPEIRDWANGDLGQRAAYVLSGLVDYYRYSGDPAAIAHVTILADVLLDHCQTSADHPWPRFLVSVPTKGKVYADCDPHGMIQLDIVAEVGIGLLRAYQITGNERWFGAVKHWANLLAQKRNREPVSGRVYPGRADHGDKPRGSPPWNRYANPEDPTWTEDQQTGGVAFILTFFDELIRLGYTGKDNSIVEARDAGREYLRDVLLPRWTINDTWGRNYWDWPDPVQAENVTEFAVRYLMENPDVFPNWRNDARNILSLFLNRTSVSPGSKGDVYSGAWAYPESSSCCGRSLWYGPLELANVYAQYGLLADSEWGREQGRRQAILATYDCHESGVVEDGLDGGPIVAGDWFKIAHPMALKYALSAMAWLPETLGAARENHIMRSSGVVTSVVYGRGEIRYATFDAPAGTIDILRLAFVPKNVTGGDKPLAMRTDAKENGYQIKGLPCGDCIVTIRHDGAKRIVVRGEDPQEVADDNDLRFSGAWHAVRDIDDLSGALRVASAKGAAMTFSFRGNQVRLIGRVDVAGGLADVYLDDVKQLVGIDCWNPAHRHQQVLYYRNGLPDGKHAFKIVARGEKNPLSRGTNLYVDAVQWSAATPATAETAGEGGGPLDVQRWVFGYPERTDYVDSRGNTWRPATEVVTRSKDGGDSVAESWWTQRRRLHIANTDNPELYRYGVHAHEFRATFTVGPGAYYARLKFAETRTIDPKLRTVTVFVNGREAITNMDIAATGGGFGRAVNVVLHDIEPLNGVIDLRFLGPPGGEAIVQAIEVGPGDGGEGAEPVSVSAATSAEAAAPGGNLLRNPDFEGGVNGQVATLSPGGGGFGWNYLFASPAQSYIWGEAAYSEHPDWGLPAFHHGREAIRTHTDGHGHTVIYQDVAVVPEATYNATTWVRAVDLHGKGFGKDACDSAGLWLQELDKDGRIVANHLKVAVTTACEYKALSRTFKTTKTTAMVRYLLDTVIGCPYTEGHVTYDDCTLIRQEAAK